LREIANPTPPALPSDPRAILARAGGENFPVASLLLPRRVRRHLLALYGFARLADEIGDESNGDRLAQLDWLDEELERAARGKATHPVLRRLTTPIETFDLPLSAFRSLIEANRWDQHKHTYETFDELAEYCRLSAVPVGVLVLSVFESATPDRLALSERVCRALQLVEHLQDVGEDARAGRVYLPQSDLRSFGCGESDLLADRATPALMGLVAFEVERARDLLAAGGPLVASLRGSARVAVAGYVGGGAAAIDAIVDAGHDVLGQACRPRRTRVLRHAAQLGLGRTGRSLVCKS
jgi:squalene synthase HpnC